MRNGLAVVLAILAGLSAVVGLVSWKLSEVIHQPESVQAILADSQGAAAFKEAVPAALVHSQTQPTGMSVVDNTIQAAISEASRRIINHEGFDTAWSESLEQTRSGWAEDLTTLRDELNAGQTIAEDSTAAQLELRFDPLASLTVSMIQDAIDAALGGLLGVGQVSITLNPDLDATVPAGLPSTSLVTAEQVVLADEAMTMWPVTLALAGLVFLMGLVVASRGSRWIVWFMSGLLVVLGGAAIKVGALVWQYQLSDPAQDSAGTMVVRPLLSAIQDWVDPQLLVMVAAGAGVALLGVLGSFISSHRRRSRT